MRIYATLGSAPLGIDRMAIPKLGETNVLVSFFDYGKAFTTLGRLDEQMREKYKEMERNDPFPRGG